MEILSLKSLLSQKTIDSVNNNKNSTSYLIARGILTESELAEGWLDTLTPGVKNLWNDLSARYAKAKAEGDRDEIDRLERQLVALKARAAVNTKPVPNKTSTPPPPGTPFPVNPAFASPAPTPAPPKVKAQPSKKPVRPVKPAVGTRPVVGAAPTNSMVPNKLNRLATVTPGKEPIPADTRSGDSTNSHRNRVTTFSVPSSKKPIARTVAPAKPAASKKSATKKPVSAPKKPIKPGIIPTKSTLPPRGTTKKPIGKKTIIPGKKRISESADNTAQETPPIALFITTSIPNMFRLS